MYMCVFICMTYLCVRMAYLYILCRHCTSPLSELVAIKVQSDEGGQSGEAGTDSITRIALSGQSISAQVKKFQGFGGVRAQPTVHGGKLVVRHFQTAEVRLILKAVPLDMEEMVPTHVQKLQTNHTTQPRSLPFGQLIVRHVQIGQIGHPCKGPGQDGLDAESGQGECEGGGASCGAADQDIFLAEALPAVGRLCGCSRRNNLCKTARKKCQTWNYPTCRLTPEPQ